MISLYDEYCADDIMDDEYCSMYFGTINGVFRQFPGVQSATNPDGSYKDYDCRFRPWFVEAASGNKDVVIILDVSGSMKNFNRLDLAKEAVKSVLNTLGSKSFVTLIAFNDDIQLSCFGKIYIFN